MTLVGIIERWQFFCVGHSRRETRSFFLLISKRSLPIFFSGHGARIASIWHIIHHHLLMMLKKKPTQKILRIVTGLRRKSRDDFSLSSSQSEPNQIHWIKKTKKKNFYFLPKKLTRFFIVWLRVFLKKKKEEESTAHAIEYESSPYVRCWWLNKVWFNE